MTGLFLAVVVAGTPSPAAAGPPFLTDDAEPVDYDHWEIIGFSMGTLVQGDAAGILPGVEVNYGAMPNVQLHVKVLAAFISQSVTGTQFGYGDTEFGANKRASAQASHPGPLVKNFEGLLGRKAQPCENVR